MSIPIGLQLWSIKDEIERDFKGTLKKVAQIGYDGVEFAGYGGLNSFELRDLLCELGIKACGSHISLVELTENIDAVIEYNLVIGNKYIICPWAEIDSKKDILELAVKLNKIGEKCKTHGLVFGYHNHAHEFKQYDGEYALDILFRETEIEFVKAEIDTYWVEYAGLNSSEYIKKYSGRCELIHIKDMRWIGDKKESTEIGNGVMDITKIIFEANKQGATWLIVEQEYFTKPPIESIKICYENLKKLVQEMC